MWEKRVLSSFTYDKCHRRLTFAICQIADFKVYWNKTEQSEASAEVWERKSVMQDLINKLLLFVSGSYIVWYLGVGVPAVFAFTMSLILSCLCTYFADHGICGVFILFFCLFCFPFPHFMPYLPLFFYDARYTDQKFLLLVMIPACMNAIVCLPPTIACPFLFLMIAAFILAGYSKKNQKLVQELHQIRDRGIEAEIHLKERNQALIQKQNYEIHAATLSERNRIAREIHDNVGHLLTRSLLQTGALKVINQDPSLSEPLDTLNDTLNTAMTSIRTSVHDLHDESIDLYHALQEIVSEDEALPIQLEYDVEHELPREIKYAFISIVKEAVNNIHKHSNGDFGKVTIREHPGFFLLQIRDNGTLCADPSNSDGIGLSGIRDRVGSFGGTLRIDTQHGFLINITIANKQT